MSDLVREITVRLGTDTTVAFYTDSILEAWVNQSYRWTTAYKRWPFTEGKVTTTYATAPEAKLYPEGWRSDSIRLLQIGSDDTPNRLQKLNFEDYQIYREDNGSGTDRVFSDYANEYYINPNVDLSGTTTLWGQYVPAPIEGSSPPSSAETVFSGREEEGNQAIIDEVISYAMIREKKTNEALLYHKSAMERLEGVWKRIKDEQYAYQTKNRGMFERIDVLRGAMNDELIKRDQFL